jgi:hypothetical protein
LRPALEQISNKQEIQTAIKDRIGEEDHKRRKEAKKKESKQIWKSEWMRLGKWRNSQVDT